MPLSYCSYTDIEDALNISITDDGCYFTNSEGVQIKKNHTMTITRVNKLIEQASRHIDVFSPYSFEEKTIQNERQTVYLDRDSGKYFFNTDYYPITETIKVEYDSTGNEDWVEMVVSLDMSNGDVYLIDPTAGKYYVFGDFTTRVKGIRVSYKYGATSVPEYVKQACIFLTCYRVLRAFAHNTSSEAEIILLDREATEFKRYADEIIKEKINVGKKIVAGGF